MIPAIDNVNKIISIIASCVSTLAIIFGGIFAWWRWGREASFARRGDLSHDVTNSLLSNSHRLVHVTLKLTNTGQSTLRPVEAYTKVFQVLPLNGDFGTKLLDGTAPLDVTNTMFQWPTIGHRKYPVMEDKVKIDSGESERYDADFVIPASVSAIFVYSMACLDPEDYDLGWDVTTFHEFPPQQQSTGRR